MNYILKKYNRKTKGNPFETYEKARQFARKQIRKNHPEDNKSSQAYATVAGDWDDVSRNPPSITTYGYSIVKQGK